MTPPADQLAVITGAGSGIGKAIALALATKGMSVALIGRQPKPLESVASAARALGAVPLVYPVDLACENAIRNLAATLARDFGRVDILVHSAAVVIIGAMADATAEDFSQQYHTNLLAPYLLTQSLLPLLRERRGQVVFINSSAGLTARANVGQYAATKHGLKAVADSLRDEVNRDGIRVLSVFPGRTATPTQERLHTIENRSYRPDLLLQPEDVASVVVSSLCLPRTAEVTEIKIRPMRNFE
jgi:NAD(P)-dependent dehydrogenase (short-subunit alcohol dehydrogenase family)